MLMLQDFINDYQRIVVASNSDEEKINSASLLIDEHYSHIKVQCLDYLEDSAK